MSTSPHNPNYQESAIWDKVWSRPYHNYEKHHQVFWKKIRDLSRGWICDLACGSASCWKGFDCRLVGVDFSIQACQQARNNCPDSTFYCSPADETPLCTHLYDTVVLCGLINYYRDLTSLKKEVKRLIAPKGLVLITINVINDFPGRTWDEDRIHQEFDEMGLVEVSFYDKIGFLIAIETL